MPRWILSLVLLALTPVGVARANEDITTFSLENGLDVVVIEDHRAAAVTHMVWYRVGSADEEAGKSGIAHFLEHLLFKGTEKLEPGEFSQIVEANGGSDNAFTAWDYTGYFQRVAADRLELMMELEADRMRNLQLTEEVVLPERDVVLEERNQRVENNPGGLFGEQRRAAQWLNHRYGVPIIGWRHEIEELGLEDALEFYRRYYAPNNAILIVAGDVDPAEVRVLAQRHFGPLEPSLDLPERVRVQEPPQLAERRIMFSDPRVAQPYVLRTYLAPERDAGRQETPAALTILAELLGGDTTTSYMGQRLVLDEQRAVYISSFYNGMSLDDTIFGLIVVPVEGVSLEDAEADMDNMIAGFISDGVNPDDLARVKMQVRANEIFSRDSVDGRARRFGTALTSGLTIEDVKDWPDVLQAVTAEDIIAAAEMVFDRRKSVTGYLQRETQTEATQ
jgi:zinc protease